jgi:hypothetical protein
MYLGSPSLWRSTLKESLPLAEAALLHQVKDDGGLAGARAPRHHHAPKNRPCVHCKKEPIQEIPENIPRKGIARGHSPNLHIHVSVSDLYFSMIDLPILLQKICAARRP